MRKSKPCIAPIVSHCEAERLTEEDAGWKFEGCAIKMALQRVGRREKDEWMRRKELESERRDGARGRLNNIIGGVLTVPGRPRANVHPSRDFAHAARRAAREGRKMGHGSARARWPSPGDGSFSSQCSFLRASRSTLSLLLFRPIVRLTFVSFSRRSGPFSHTLTSCKRSALNHPLTLAWLTDRLEPTPSSDPRFRTLRSAVLYYSQFHKLLFFCLPQPAFKQLESFETQSAVYCL